jgi:hypothetical protein
LTLTQFSVVSPRPLADIDWILAETTFVAPPEREAGAIGHFLLWVEPACCLKEDGSFGHATPRAETMRSVMHGDQVAKTGK